jgi:hypothetical protein
MGTMFNITKGSGLGVTRGFKRWSCVRCKGGSNYHLQCN